VRRTKINADAVIGVITTASLAVGIGLLSRYCGFTPCSGAVYSAATLATWS
jgi:ABC-type Mn2+/Zn2+ transport system permease subunit